MPKKRRTQPTPLHSRDIEVLATDDRAFDVKVVQSALAFFNGWAEARNGGVIPTRDIVESAYSWLPPVLAIRARNAGIQPGNVKWAGDSSMELVNAFTVVFMLLCSNLDFGRNSAGAVTDDGRRFSASEWFDRCLSPLPIYSRFKFDGTGVRRIDVPCITTVQRALAYAIAALLEDRWRVRDRVRRCPYDRHGMHFFLDYRIDNDGRLSAGEPMKYCCQAHANAHRQQLWRTARKESAK